MRRLSIDVWSDIACPWCYIGKRRLEGALARFPQRDAIDLRWHAFELDPNAERVRATSGDHAADIARKYGTTLARARAMVANVVDSARSEGLDFHMDALRPGNTFDAHRVVALALETGGPSLQVAMTERFMRAYLGEGAALGERETLVRLATEVGLAASEVRVVLESDRFRDEVRADEARAQTAGISGVPCFVLDWRYGISGAQPSEILLKAIEQAWSELPEPVAVGDGDACGPDGCA